MKFCKKCGAQMADEERFCIQCGENNETTTVIKPVTSAPIPPKKNKKLITGVITGIVVILAIVGIILAITLKSDEEKESEKEVISDEIKSAEIGDYIEFGEYEQDGDESNGKEDIEWLVLDKEADRILVISKYALDCRPYHEECEDITWEECTLREWLNDDFINEAFSDQEQTVIPTVTVEVDVNPRSIKHTYYGEQYTVDPGNNTEDKIFVLSMTEVNEYFEFKNQRECVATKYAVENGVDVYSEEYFCEWWLRTAAISQDGATYVYRDGSVNSDGFYVDEDNNAIRPAMWIDLDTSKNNDYTKRTDKSKTEPIIKPEEVDTVPGEEVVTGEPVGYIIATKLDIGYVLDVDSSANLQIWERDINRAQYFDLEEQENGYYRIININSNKALAAQDIGGEYPNVCQEDIGASDYQYWNLEETGNGSYYIIEKESGLYLDVDNAWTENGTNVKLFKRNTAYQAQNWLLIKR